MPTMTQPATLPSRRRDRREVTGGVDTHKDTHTAAVVDARPGAGAPGVPDQHGRLPRVAGLAALAR